MTSDGDAISSGGDAGLSNPHPAAPAASREIARARGAIHRGDRSRDTTPGYPSTDLRGSIVGSDMAQMLRVGSKGR
jgi:hypothetical protein